MSIPVNAAYNNASNAYQRWDSCEQSWCLVLLQALDCHYGRLAT